MPRSTSAIRLASALALASLLLSDAAHAEVRTVGALPADEYPTIQQAVNAANDGDVILVRDGDYPSFVVDDKALAIFTRRPPGEAQVQVGTIRVRNLSAGKTLVLSGLSALGTTSDLPWEGAGTYLVDCQGSLRFQACTLQGADGYGASPLWVHDGSPGAQIENCTDVVFTECEIRGGQSSPVYVNGQDTGGYGMRLVSSNVGVYGGMIRGGDGADADDLDAGFGGRGVSSSGSLLFLSSTYVKGGDGGDADVEGFGGWGGDGVSTSPNGQTYVVDVVPVPGYGGYAPGPCGFVQYCSGEDGQPTVGPFTDLGGSSRLADAFPPVRYDTEAITLATSGLAGDRVLLFSNTETGFQFDAARFGVAALGEGPFGRAAHGLGGGLAGWAPLGSGDPLLGVADAQGNLSVDLLWNPLPPAEEALVLHTQTVSIDAGSSDLFLGPPWTVVALNSVLFAGDCNLNGIPDDVDIANGVSTDCNGDGIADDCAGSNDCNGNGGNDWCDLPFYADPDCNGNGLPDVCEGLFDCNGNGIGDVCDIASGTSTDANADGVPDECQVSVFRVDDDAPEAGQSGLSWNNAYRSLQDALAMAQHVGTVQEIWVAEGTYRPAPPGGDPLASFHVPASLSLLGGFAGTETQADQRDPLMHPTILDGDLLGDDGPDFTGRDDNSEDVLIVERGDHRVSGFIVRGGGNPTIDRAPSGGSGLTISEDGPAGSAMTTVDRCRFVDNQGPGVYSAVNSRFWNCAFVGNQGRFASGLDCRGAHLEVVNCLFTGNRADPSYAFSAALAYYPSSVPGWSASFVLRCSTIAHNDAIGVRTDSWPRDFRDTILWGNRMPGSTLSIESQQLYGSGSNLWVSYSCIEGLTTWVGHGNIGADPLFVDPLGPDGVPWSGDEDLRLGAGSPCIDAGRNGDLPADALDLDGDGNTSEFVPIDLDGGPRRADDPAVPDTGSGVAPVTDMGAYERQGP